MADPDEDVCGPDVHIHHLAVSALVVRGFAILYDHDIAALVPGLDRTIADRLCELLNRYGLTDITDIPDTPPPAFPPPDLRTWHGQTL